MNSFLNLKTVYDKPDQRTIEDLKEVYFNPEYLHSAILELMGDHINSQNIKGKHILLKPNWVKHDKLADDNLCLCTHKNIIIEIIRILLAYSPSLITIGDAPIQGCNMDKICTIPFINEIKLLSDKFQIPVVIRDFRRVVFDSLKNNLTRELNPISDYIIFDLGKESFLELISQDKKNLFRVAHYDHDKLALMHHKGVHKYCITKSLFEADIIISIPKIKTHQYAGITGALKNLVGVNGDKDYLPHYRTGAIIKGGDSYLKNNTIRNFSNMILDISNKNIGNPSFRYLQKLAIVLWKLSKPGINDQWGAGWHGNDTTWRMVLDLNQIAVYGKIDGTLAEVPQRQIFSLCDAIIAGQGNGPLTPLPLPMGILSFTNNGALSDYVFAYLMKFKPEKLALISNAFKIYENSFNNIFLNDNLIKFNDLADYSLDTLPPSGWINFLKNSE